MEIYREIKDKVNLLSLITAETGKKIKKKHLEECPFCGGHSCFSIKEQGYKCFQCDAVGDVFNFLEGYRNIDKAEALRQAAQTAGVKLKQSAAAKKDPAKIKLTVQETIFLEAAKHYQANLPDNGGLAYFIEHRGHEKSVLEAMGLGWSTGELLLHLRSKGYPDEQIKASGLAVEREIDGQPVLVDYFRKNLAIFPHLERGKVLTFTQKDPQKKLDYQLPADYRHSSWRFYNQGALSKHNEVILVEGENDLLSLMDTGINNVAALIGQPADYQIKVLKGYCAAKRLYLWLDNDTGGKKFVRKICTDIGNPPNVRVVVCDDTFKDPDEYLKSFSGDRKKEVKRLQGEALDYLSWEIAEIAKLDALEERLKALKDRKVFTAVGDLFEADKEVYVEKLEHLGFTRAAIEEQLSIDQDLKLKLARYFEVYGRKDADPNQVADMIFTHFSQQGRFFRDGMNDVYLLYKHTIYSVGNNRPFNALIKMHSGLLPTKEPGRSVWEALASDVFNKGVRINLASWIETDRMTDTVYVNLNLPSNKILKISKSGIVETDNGINEEGILLKSSQKISSLGFLSDADIREGMRVLKELVFDNLTCEREQRYLILCWLFSAFLLDFAPYMGLMKFSGASSSGKTTAARLLSLLLYGNEHLGDTSTAAAYAVAAQNPLLIIDNLESNDITKSILKFLLLSATKGGKEKRTQGTDSGTFQEQPKALVLITAIEPFTKAELINRTYDVDFSGKFKSDGFVEDEVIRELLKKRDLIVSAILKFLSKDVLPNLASRRDFISVLKKEHKGHSKNRTDEYLATLLLMMEKLLKYIPYSDPDDFPYGENKEEKVIRRAWISYQDAKAKETETTSNNIIKLLEGVVREYLDKMRAFKSKDLSAHKGYEDFVWVYTHPEYLLEVVKTKAITVRDDDSGEEYTQAYFDFVATSNDIVAVFDRFCRNNGIKNPYGTASVFSSRLRNDASMLQKSGWELVSKKSCEPYYTRIKGQRFWKFRKLLIK